MGFPLSNFLFCIVSKWFSIRASISCSWFNDLEQRALPHVLHCARPTRNRSEMIIMLEWYGHCKYLYFFCKYLRVFSCLEYKNRYPVFVQLDMDGIEKHHKVFTLHVPMYVCSIWCKTKKKKKKNTEKKNKQNKTRNKFWKWRWASASFCGLFSFAGTELEWQNMALIYCWTDPPHPLSPVCPPLPPPPTQLYPASMFVLYSFVPATMMPNYGVGRISCKYVVMSVKIYEHG